MVDAPADLVTGVYEGGLKTWECAVDFTAYIDREVPCVRGLRVLELSCRTAVLTLLLLDRLFVSLVPESGTELAGVDETPETVIHAQDYHRAVLELITFPNVLLAWCTFPSSLFAPGLIHVRRSELLAFDYDMVFTLHSELAERSIVPARLRRLHERQGSAEPHSARRLGPRPLAPWFPSPARRAARSAAACA